MNDEAKKRGSSKSAEPQPPIDVVEGIPDRSSRLQTWKYVVIGLIFLAWMAFLIYCIWAGR